jgi:hypothetical protein
LLSPAVGAEVLERVVAVVDGELVMLSELEESYQETVNAGIEVSREEVLEGLINRILLFNQSRKITRRYMFTARVEREENVLINEYIEKRLKAFIRIPQNEVERFYQENRGYFSEGFYEVRDEIEAYLIELELNEKLSEHLEELRKKSRIRIQMSFDYDK